jgi:hypothetical protein
VALQGALTWHQVCPVNDKDPALYSHTLRRWTGPGLGPSCRAGAIQLQHVCMDQFTTPKVHCSTTTATTKP